MGQFKSALDSPAMGGMGSSSDKWVTVAPTLRR